MKGGAFYGTTRQKSFKCHKMDIVVIRVNPAGELVNARPCYNCLDMMKAVGIRKVHYSVEGDIVTEKVDKMVSINASSILRHIERQVYNAPMDDDSYYKRLLVKNFPKYIYRHSLECFLEHNIKNVLPHFKWKQTKTKITFIDNSNNIVLVAVIV